MLDRNSKFKHYSDDCSGYRPRRDRKRERKRGGRGRGRERDAKSDRVKNRVRETGRG
jgi:hypothetical protein